jgi:hypothetical protein
MTFEEAKKAKEKIGYGIIEEDGFTFKIFVTPALKSDLDRYWEIACGSVIRGLTDEDAIDYSTNGDFILRGLNVYCVSDGQRLSKLINVSSNK